LITDNKQQREDFINGILDLSKLQMKGIYDINIYTSMLKKALTLSSLKKMLNYKEVA